jgi:glc operon protein GlcG
MPLKLEEVNKVIAGAQKKAAEIGIKITVAVVDEAGNLQGLSRMDGAPAMSPQVAEAKAHGCAWTGRDGEAMAAVYKDRPGFFAVIDKMARVPLVPGLGSSLIKRSDAVLGAVGVSGGKPEQDLECCQAALVTSSEEKP